MSSKASFEDRVRGCLIGCAIGAELGEVRRTRADVFAVKEPEDVLNLRLDKVERPPDDRLRLHAASMAPFVNVGIKAYVAKDGRVTPEDFAAAMIDDPGLCTPAFSWDGIHTVQELLKEGIQPRIAGLGNAPNGMMAACMPAVGIYHFADPEYAYLDGVELASVAQPRLCADWAGLCGAAIAAAFDGNADAESIVNTVLRIAHQNNKDLFYELNTPTIEAQNRLADQPAFATWWMNYGGRGDSSNRTGWINYNPIRFVLPLLKGYCQNAEQFMALVLAPDPATGMQGFGGSRAVSAIVGGAILGALSGPDIFPPEWRKWAEPQAKPWCAISDVVAKRAGQERSIVTELAAKTPEGISRLQDRIYGCMLASAIGNAMGSPVETQHYWEIDERYPGGVMTVLEPSRLETEDDNQMAMLLAETYLDREGLPVMARHFGETWKQRLNRDHFYPGCMGSAYDLIRQGWDARISGHWSMVTGSTVMCMEPVGIYHVADPEFAAIDATAISYMYQRGLDVVAASDLAAAVAEALRPNATVDSVLQAALDFAPRGPLKTFDERPFESAYHYLRVCLDVAAKYDDVLAARAELYEKCLLYHCIDPLELWGLSLAMLKIANGDVRQSAIGGTNIGRDSDTIAGRAAMLSGALRGSAGVPEDWIALFKPEVLDRIKTNAGRFADLIANGRLRRLEARGLARG